MGGGPLAGEGEWEGAWPPVGSARFTRAGVCGTGCGSACGSMSSSSLCVVEVGSVAFAAAAGS